MGSRSIMAPCRQRLYAIWLWGRRFGSRTGCIKRGIGVAPACCCDGPPGSLLIIWLDKPDSAADERHAALEIHTLTSSKHNPTHRVAVSLGSYQMFARRDNHGGISIGTEPGQWALINKNAHSARAED